MRYIITRYALRFRLPIIYLWIKMFDSPMKLAIEEAKAAITVGEVPVGALVLDAKKQIIARGHNMTRSLQDPSAHAELVVLRKACKKLNSDRLIGCSIYVTLEPCAMCASAISLSRISNLYYGASDQKSGGIEYGAKIFTRKQTHFKPNVFSGFCEEEINKMMSNFFQSIREHKQADKRRC